MFSHVQSHQFFFFFSICLIEDNPEIIGHAVTYSPDLISIKPKDLLSISN